MHRENVTENWEVKMTLVAERGQLSSDSIGSDQLLGRMVSSGCLEKGLNTLLLSLETKCTAGHSKILLIAFFK